ncbi:ROK family transcriptional regulator [Methylobrevis pamukkalensis]|uniref:N-acetylglucosamine repressor n=1 Tax=Methylobrevis pamukkalensis TaxID=1439726 RepID=A0A1E3H8C2_9HYPH|nr:ROK family transcriptional regulator [Methylobrevis pamukkalensis]ODN72578.1 N-acetylglucosamine repressor [Methylobrevis pamukkalensis]
MTPRATRTGQGTNSAQVRQFNERIVLRALRRLGEASKSDLAQAAGLTSNAIGEIIRELETLGLVRELGKKREGQRGQPASIYELDPAGAFAIGVRLDRVATEVVRVDLAGRVQSRRSHDSLLPPPDEMLEILAADIASLRAELSPAEQTRLTGVGLAQPFHLASWLRELELPPSSFRLWQDVDFAAALSRACGLPVFAENDGNAAAIAELFYGCGREIDDFIYLFVGGAVGGGIVKSGDCVHGVNGNAGDFAMMPVAASGLASAPRPDKPFDVLLTRASLTALKRHLRWHGHDVTSVSALSGVLREDRAAGAIDEWLDDCADALAAAVLSSVALLDIQTVVIDAGVDHGLVRRLIVRLDARLAEATPESMRPPVLRSGSFGADAGALGAATLPLFFNFSPRSSILTSAGAAIREARDHAAAE